MNSFPDEKISSISRTSDFNGFEGLRVIVWQGVKGGDLSTRRKGLPYFMVGYRPGEERRSTVAESRGKGGVGIPMKRVSAVTPPEQPFEATYANAQGRSASFQIESRFLADVIRRAGFASVKYVGRSVQSPTWRPTPDLRITAISVDFFGAPLARRPNNTDASKSTNRPKEHTNVLDGTELHCFY